MTSSDGKTASRDSAFRERAIVLAFTLAIAAVAWWRSDGDVAIVLGALGVPALFYATVQFGDARRTIGNIESIGTQLEVSADRVDDIREVLSFSTDRLEHLREELSDSTERLEEQLSTQRIGVFPEFLPKIVELLSSATESVVIFCDFPAYGEFSNPAAFKEYADVVSGKGNLVSLLCLDKDARRQLTAEQVSKGGWGHWKSLHETEISEYLSAHRSLSSFRSIEHEEFVEVLAKGDTRTLEEEFETAERWVTTLVMPIYFWIVDDDEAVFALAPFMQSEALEVGFRTSDKDLIGALKGIFKRYEGMTQTRSL